MRHTSMLRAFWDTMGNGPSSVTRSPCPKIGHDETSMNRKAPLVAELSFDYDGKSVRADWSGSRIVDARCEKLHGISDP